MPFYQGCGFHDAPWRGEFGGSIYLESGSHGCVNLPPDVADRLYHSIYVGLPVIVYYAD
jgi:lipoprotein-anchoring transpeptidase ErfK/SrfK